jgi:uncharacterized protein YukE
LAKRDLHNQSWFQRWQPASTPLKQSAQRLAQQYNQNDDDEKEADRAAANHEGTAKNRGE